MTPDSIIAYISAIGPRATATTRGPAPRCPAAPAGDAHEAVIHDDGQLVCHHSVTPPYEKVSAVTREQLLVGAVAEIIECDDASGVVCV